MTRNRTSELAAATALLAVVGLSIHPLEAQKAISADGVVQSTSGGLKFPDGSVQTSAAVMSTAPVPDTGIDATQCADDTGLSRSCVGTGEDGEYQAGLALPTPRFTDNGDGTVTDNLTGLVWLQDADCPSGAMGWQAALDWVASLNSSAVTCTNYAAMTYTDWRLPNIREVLSLVDFGAINPALPSGHPFVNVQSAFYWSSSSALNNLANAWTLNFSTGDTGVSGDKDSFTDSVWPVRGGH
jgi:Protein of unknown function (DUF1566)